MYSVFCSIVVIFVHLTCLLKNVISEFRVVSRMAERKAIQTRSGRSVKPPVEKYTHNCVMNADKVAKYKKKKKETIATCQRVNNHRANKVKNKPVKSGVKKMKSKSTG